MTTTKRVVLFGAGTVAKRAADLLCGILPSDVEIGLVRHGVKLPKDIAKKRENEARTHNQDISREEIEELTTWKKGDATDSRTKELKQLFSWHKDRFTTYLAQGKRLEERIIRMEEAGLAVQGIVYPEDKLADEPFKNIERKKQLKNIMDLGVSLAIDASETGIDERNVADIYTPNNWPFCLNGGAKGTLVDHNYFAGILGTTADYTVSKYIEKDSMVVSCNTHAVTMFLSLLKHTLSPADELEPILERETNPQIKKELTHALNENRQRADNHFRTMVRSIDIKFLRRYEDPHVGKPVPEFIAAEESAKHMKEIEILLPATEGKLYATSTKIPCQYFHTVYVTVNFEGKVNERLVDELKLKMRKHPRIILSELSDGKGGRKAGIDQEQIILAAGWAGINDGDLPHPIMSPRKLGDYAIETIIATPQRGIVAPSIADITLLRLGYEETLRNACKRTNRGMYRGIRLADIKGGVQDNLLNYHRKKEIPGYSTDPRDYLGIRIDGKIA